MEVLSHGPYMREHQGMQDTPVIIDVQYVTQDNGFLVEMTFIDMTKRDLGILEFIDDNQYTNMEYSMVSLGCM